MHIAAAAINTGSCDIQTPPRPPSPPAGRQQFTVGRQQAVPLPHPLDPSLAAVVLPASLRACTLVKTLSGGRGPFQKAENAKASATPWQAKVPGIPHAIYIHAMASHQGLPSLTMAPPNTTDMDSTMQHVRRTGRKRLS